jgi:hypothetical protein
MVWIWQFEVWVQSTTQSVPKQPPVHAGGQVPGVASVDDAAQGPVSVVVRVMVPVRVSVSVSASVSASASASVSVSVSTVGSAKAVEPSAPIFGSP